MHFADEKFNTVLFRGSEIKIEKDNFKTIQNFRSERISDKMFYNDGKKTTDFFASNEIRLVDRGEICPREMGVISSPRSEFIYDLERRFGDAWFSYDDWEPADLEFYD